MTTCQEFATLWIELHPRESAQTNANCEQMVRGFAEHFGCRSLADIGRREAREWALENRAAARYVRAMMNDALDDELIEANVFANLRLPGSRGRKDIVVPTAEEIWRLQIAAAAPLTTMIPFAAYTGLRLGEQLALTPADFAGDRVAVTKQLDRRSREVPPKTPYSVRNVMIPPQGDIHLDLPEHGRIWPLSRSQHFRLWDAARKETGLLDYDWHTLRHYCATWFLELGASPRDVGIQLGHENENRVIELYGHPDREEALNRLARLAA